MQAASLHAVSLACASAKYRFDTLRFSGPAGEQLQLTPKLAVEVNQDGTFSLTTSHLFSFRTHLAARYFQFNTSWLGLSAALGFRVGGDRFSVEVLGGADKNYLAEQGENGDVQWHLLVSPLGQSSLIFGIYRTSILRAWLRVGGAVRMPASIKAERSRMGVTGFSELSVDFLPSQVPLRIFGRAEVGDLGWNQNKYQSIQFGLELQLGVTAATLSGQAVGREAPRSSAY